MRLCVLLLAAASAYAADAVEAFGQKWTVPAAKDWQVTEEGGLPVLKMLVARPSERPRRPTQFALSGTGPFRSVTVDADVKRIGTSLIIVYAYHDAAHFNYAHLSTDTGVKAPAHNGIFHVYGGDRVRISSEQGPAAFGPDDRWYKVRLVHDGSTGIVAVSVDGKELPALNAVDLSLGSGRIGLGSFFETAMFRNVKITGTPVK